MKRLIQRWSLLLLLAAAGSLLSSAASGLNSSYLVPSGNTKIDNQLLKTPLKICALTFDDGPDSKYTMQVHDILREQGIRATFFVVGRNVDRYPEQVMALAEYGHEIGNHSYSHRDLLKLSKANIRKEMSDTSKILDKLGIHARWFRPPYGSFNRTVVDIVADEGMDTMCWSVDPQDWMRPGVATIQKRVLEKTVPGSVILMHSTVSQTVEALPGIIDGLRKQGYTFVTVSEWQQLVSGSQSLDNIRNGRSVPLEMPAPGMPAPQLPEAGRGGLLSSESDIWQRVPAGRPGSATRHLTVYSNFVDDNDLRRVLDDGASKNQIQAEGSIGDGLLRVLAGEPPQQIVAVVEEPGDARDGRSGVAVEVVETPVQLAPELLSSAAAQAAQAVDIPLVSPDYESPAGPEALEEAPSPAVEQISGNLPTVNMTAPAVPAGPVSLGGGAGISINLTSPEYASQTPLADDGSIAFVSYASSPDALEWGGLRSYMQLCGIASFGYARGYSAGKAPADFPFAAGPDQEGRQRLELGMFNPAKFLQEPAGTQWFIPLRSSDLARLTGESLYSGVSNGFREFMLLRHFTNGLTQHGSLRLSGLAEGQSAASFGDGSNEVIVIAAPRPGIELELPEQYLGWQRISVDDEGHLESTPAGSRVSEAGRLLILVQEGGD